MANETSLRMELEKTVSLASLGLKNYDFLTAFSLYSNILCDYCTEPYNRIITEKELFSVKCCYAYCGIMSRLETLREKAQKVLNELSTTESHAIVFFLKIHDSLIEKRLDIVFSHLIMLNSLIELNLIVFEETIVLNKDILPIMDKNKFLTEIEKLKISCGVELIELISEKFFKTVLTEMSEMRNESSHKCEDVSEITWQKRMAAVMPHFDIGVQFNIPQQANQFNQNKNKHFNIKIMQTFPTNSYSDKWTQSTIKNFNNKTNTDQSVTCPTTLDLMNEIKKINCNPSPNIISERIREKEQEIEFLKRQLKMEQDRFSMFCSGETKTVSTLREQLNSTQSRLEKCQKKSSHLQKIFLGRTLQEYQWQKSIYSKLEEHCNRKIEFFNSLQTYVTDLNFCIDKETCKRQIEHWKKHKEDLNKNKKKFEAHLKKINELMSLRNYQQLSLDWPELPKLLLIEKDILYKNFRMIAESFKNSILNSATTTTIPESTASAPVAINHDMEKSLLSYLQSTFSHVDEMTLLNAIIAARGMNGGKLSDLNKSAFINNVKQILSKDLPCIICLDKINKKKLFQLKCHHSFHKTCIQGWLMKKNECPVCRRHVAIKEFPGP